MFIQLKEIQEEGMVITGVPSKPMKFHKSIIIAKDVKTINWWPEGVFRWEDFFAHASLGNGEMLFAMGEAAGQVAAQAALER